MGYDAKARHLLHFLEQLFKQSMWTSCIIFSNFQVEHLDLSKKHSPNVMFVNLGVFPNIFNFSIIGI
jgi:hypothetical protein